MQKYSVDDTTMRVQDPGAHKTRTALLWCTSATTRIRIQSSRESDARADAMLLGRNTTLTKLILTIISKIVGLRLRLAWGDVMNRLAALLAVVLVSALLFAEDSPAQPAPNRRSTEKVFRENVAPKWLPGNQSFWYQIAAAPDTQEFVFVDAVTGTIRRADSLAKLALPDTAAQAKPEPAKTSNPPRRSEKSPDGKWSVRFDNFNAVLVPADGEALPLTTDGNEQRPYRGPVAWSPDSQHCVVLRAHDVKRREVTIVESSPRGQVQPKFVKYDYFKPGDELPHAQPALISVADRKLKTIPDELYKNAFMERAHLDIRWSPRGEEFYFTHNQRGHQVYRVLAVSAASGEIRTVVEERSKTFINHHSIRTDWLDATGELLWLSERDGWMHLWLYDVAKGAVKNQVTRGPWVVRRVLNVDAEKRQVWFMASGLRTGEDPYHNHLCRVNFDGSGFQQLTEGDGDHTVEFSPDARYFLDRWSRVDQPRVTELRRSDDGSRVCELERADISRLLATGWTMPERFVAKGRDGKTDIYGILIKPANFDPKKKYPVVEQVYAGPHGAFTPKTFGRQSRLNELANLGFILVQADGMGTNYRGKVFHDVCWKNLEDAGFPDRIAWIKAAAESRPWMDLSRVGIYGGSAGGQSAMRALLAHNDFYKVAVADCGCHDNRMDKIWWNEQWLGWPVDEAYIRSSNVENAAKLQGQLLLIVGELDRNVDPASTLQVVGALQRAGKSFEFMPIVGADHGAAETSYGTKLRTDFLVKHLLAPAATK